MDHQSRFNNRTSQSTNLTAASANRSLAMPRLFSSGSWMLDIDSWKRARN